MHRRFPLRLEYKIRCPECGNFKGHLVVSETHLVWSDNERAYVQEHAAKLRCGSCGIIMPQEELVSGGRATGGEPHK